jgi:hypothetical protein
MKKSGHGHWWGSNRMKRGGSAGRPGGKGDYTAILLNFNNGLALTVISIV